MLILAAPGRCPDAARLGSGCSSQLREMIAVPTPPIRCIGSDPMLRRFSHPPLVIPTNSLPRQVAPAGHPFGLIGRRLASAIEAVLAVCTGSRSPAPAPWTWSSGRLLPAPRSRRPLRSPPPAAVCSPGNRLIEYPRSHTAPTGGSALGSSSRRGTGRGRGPGVLTPVSLLALSPRD